MASGNLGKRNATGALTTQNKVTPGTLLWVVEFSPQNFSVAPDFEIWHGAARGPGGYFLVYIDDSLFGVAENGLINEYAPQIPMYVRDGQFVRCHWSVGTGTAPEVVFYLREPEVGRL